MFSRSTIAAAAVSAIAAGTVFGVTSAQAAPTSDELSPVTQPSQAGDAPTPEAISIQKGENGDLHVAILDKDSLPTDGWEKVQDVTGKAAAGKSAAGKSADFEPTTPGAGDDAPNPAAVAVVKEGDGEAIKSVDQDSLPADLEWTPTSGK